MKEQDKQRSYEQAEKLISEQNFTAALIVGAAASILAAVAYGLTTLAWGFTYGFAAVGIGIAVGVSMQFLGRGIHVKYAVVASLYTVAGCVLGNVFRVAMSLAQGSSSSILEVFGIDVFPTLVERSLADVSAIHLMFWCVAVWFAVFLAKRPLSRADSLALGLYRMQR